MAGRKARREQGPLGSLADADFQQRKAQRPVIGTPVFLGRGFLVGNDLKEYCVRNGVSISNAKLFGPFYRSKVTPPLVFRNGHCWQ